MAHQMQNYKTGKNSAKQKGAKTKMKPFIGSSSDTQHPGHKEHSKNRSATGELTHFFSVLSTVKAIGKIHQEPK